MSRGINYGNITALPNGSVDTSQVSGVDPDLRVKPFFITAAQSRFANSPSEPLTTKWECRRLIPD